MDIVLYIIAIVFILDLLFMALVVPRTRERGYDDDFKNPSIWIPFDGVYKIFAFVAGSVIIFNFAKSGLGVLGVIVSSVLVFAFVRYFEGASPLVSIPKDRIWVSEGRFNSTYGITSKALHMVIKYNLSRVLTDVFGVISIILLVTL